MIVDIGIAAGRSAKILSIMAPPGAGRPLTMESADSERSDG
jgi:hypothetical protein